MIKYLLSFMKLLAFFKDLSRILRESFETHFFKNSQGKKTSEFKNQIFYVAFPIFFLYF